MRRPEACVVGGVGGVGVRRQGRRRQRLKPPTADAYRAGAYRGQKRTRQL